MPKRNIPSQKRKFENDYSLLKFPAPGNILFLKRTPSKIAVMHVLGTLQLLGKAEGCSHMISLFPEKGARQDHA